MNVTEALKILALQLSHFSPPPSSIAAVTSGDDTVLLTPGRMSQRQVKERDKEKEKEKEKEAGLQTPNREHIATPSNLSPGVSYSHGELSAAFSHAIRDSFLALLPIVNIFGSSTINRT